MHLNKTKAVGKTFTPQTFTNLQVSSLLHYCTPLSSQVSARKNKYRNLLYIKAFSQINIRYSFILIGGGGEKC